MLDIEPLMHAARDVAIENNAYAQMNGALPSRSGDIMPDATYSTFQNSGHYSIKVQCVCVSVCMLIVSLYTLTILETLY